MKEELENHFIAKFKKKLITVKNEEILIQNEINQIELFTSTDGGNPNFMGGLNFANETNSVFDLMEMGNRVYFNSVFSEYLINGEIQPIFEFKEEGDLIPTDDDFLKEEREDAINFANYYQWLIELKKETNKTFKKNKPQLTHKQKMLALYYLGLDLSDIDNVKTAKILSQILDTGEENTRKYLSYLSNGKNNVRTKQNLEKVSQLFENAGITKISNQINTEIEKIN